MMPEHNIINALTCKRKQVHSHLILAWRMASVADTAHYVHNFILQRKTGIWGERGTEQKTELNNMNGCRNPTKSGEQLIQVGAFTISFPSWCGDGLSALGGGLGRARGGGGRGWTRQAGAGGCPSSAAAGRRDAQCQSSAPPLRGDAIAPSLRPWATAALSRRLCRRRVAAPGAVPAHAASVQRPPSS